jgi:hypothetical protein
MQQELAGCQFANERLSKRFSMVLKQLAEGTGESMPLACQDWANTKAAHRFFANERVSEADIMAGHFRATREGAATVGGTLLVLHDTTEFSYPRENIGLLHKGRRNWPPWAAIRCAASRCTRAWSWRQRGCRSVCPR